MENSPFLEVVTFLLGQQTYSFDIAHVKEVIRLPDITKVPKASKMIEGVFNLRGNVIAVIDLRKYFQLEIKNYPRNTRIIILEIQNLIAGVIVDAVLEVRNLNISNIELPSSLFLEGQESQYVVGVVKLDDTFLSLLSIEKILETAYGDSK